MQKQPMLLNGSLDYERGQSWGTFRQAETLLIQKDVSIAVHMETTGAWYT